MGDFDVAENYLSKYLETFPPHARAYTVLIRYSVKNTGSIERAISYWNQMKRFKIVLDAAAYNSIIAAHSDANLIEKAADLYQEFKQTGQYTTPELINTMIVLLGKQGRILKMESLYQKATNTPTNRMSSTANMILLNSLMTGYSYAGQWKKALVLWNHLRAQKQDFNATNATNATFSPQINLFNNMATESAIARFGFDAVTLCVILDTLGISKQLKKVRQVWHDVIKNKFPLTLNNITSYVEALLRCSEDEEAVQIVLNLSNFGLYPDRKILRNCIHLLPIEKRAEVSRKINEKYPDILTPRDLSDGSANQVLLRSTITNNLKSGDEGLTEEQLKLHMELKHGTLLLPPIADFISSNDG